MENGKLNGHANGTATSSSPEGGAEVEGDPGTERPKPAFLSLEQEEKGQAKASVVEVFKKVTLRFDGTI